MEDWELFGSSPSGVVTSTLSDYYDATANKQQSPNNEKSSLGLEAFLRELPQQIARRKELGITAGSLDDPIMSLLE